MGYRNLLPLPVTSRGDRAGRVVGRRAALHRHRGRRRCRAGDDVVAGGAPRGHPRRRAGRASALPATRRGRGVPGPRGGRRGASPRRGQRAAPARPRDRLAPGRPGRARRRPAAACWSSRRPSAGGARLQWRRGGDREPPARSRWRCGTGSPSAASTGSCCCCCPAVLVRGAAVHLPVPLRPRAVVPADAAAGRSPTTARFFADPYQRGTIWTTLRLALPAALLNVGASVPIAYRMRGRFRGKRLLTTVLVVPITLGTVLTAQGLLQLPRPDRLVQPDAARRSGWSTSRSGSSTTTGACSSPWSSPGSRSRSCWCCRTCRASTRPWSGPRRPSARAGGSASGGSRCRCSRPGLATTFCLTFVLAFCVFPSAVLVGDPAGETRVISIAAYQAALRAVRLLDGAPRSR